MPLSFSLPPWAASAALLLGANLFMTFAWYGHLKFRSVALPWVIFASWGIAFFEYCLQVPANRIGHTSLSAPQLKLLQEVLSLGVFAVFSVTYLGEGLRWNHAVAGLCLLGAAYFGFMKS